MRGKLCTSASQLGFKADVHRALFDGSDSSESASDSSEDDVRALAACNKTSVPSALSSALTHALAAEERQKERVREREREKEREEKGSKELSETFPGRANSDTESMLYLADFSQTERGENNATPSVSVQQSAKSPGTVDTRQAHSGLENAPSSFDTRASRGQRQKAPQEKPTAIHITHTHTHTQTVCVCE